METKIEKSSKEIIEEFVVRETVVEQLFIVRDLIRSKRFYQILREVNNVEFISARIVEMWRREPSSVFLFKLKVKDLWNLQNELEKQCLTTQVLVENGTCYLEIIEKSNIS
jgi:hypothetical protein